MAAQVPEFSQQYVQRLGGAVDALGRVVADFDASAAAEGLSRAAALAQMTGTPFLDRRRSDMEATFARHARLEADLAALTHASALGRAAHLATGLDRAVAREAYGAYQPALPVTTDGLLFGGGGFLGGLGLAGLLRAGLGAMRRRRPAA